MSTPKQSRRTISVAGTRLWAFRAECIRARRPMASVLDDLIREWLASRGAPLRARRPDPSELRNNGEPPTTSAHLTW